MVYFGIRNLATPKIRLYMPVKYIGKIQVDINVRKNKRLKNILLPAFALCLGALLAAFPANASFRNGGEQYCQQIDQAGANNQPYYRVEGNCVIERVDSVTDARLCRIGLLGEQQPLPGDPANAYVKTALPACWKFCFFDEASIMANPPPWPADNPAGPRPSWNAQTKIDCPRDAATGRWQLGPAPIFQKRTECRDVPSASNPGMCRKACKVFEGRVGFVKGRNYGSTPQWVQVEQGIKNIQIVDNEAKIIDNPPFACSAR